MKKLSTLAATLVLTVSGVAFAASELLPSAPICAPFGLAVFGAPTQ